MDTLTDLLFAGAFLLVVLATVVERIAAVHLVLAYLFLAVIAFNQYDYHENDGISPLFSVQVALTFALGTVLIVLVIGGSGLRWLELVAVFGLVLVFVLARDDLGRVLPATRPYLVGFAVLFAIFLSHAHEFPAGSGLGLFPVFAGVVLAFNLFVLPQYVSADTVYWAVGAVATGVVLLSLPALLIGDYTIWALEIRTWNGSVALPLLDRELPILRSIFANPNTFGLLLFPGTVAASIATHRTFTRSYPILAVLPASALPILAGGLYLSSSRASMLATAIAIGVYSLAAIDRKLLPGALLSVGVAVPVVLVLIHLSVLPIDPANRFTLWRAGIEATYYDSGLLGQGIVGTRNAIDPYLDIGGSVHNSYLSVFIRAGVVGGLAYGLVVLGPLLHGALRYDRVDPGMLSLATGFAVHQLFEAYTLYQFGPGSILGALAVGYVIASLGDDGDPTPAPAETRGDTSDPNSRSAIDGVGYGRDARYRTDRHDERS